MNPTNEQATAVDAHYGRATDLEGVAVAALTAAGMDIDHLTVTDLAPLDQFHTGGIDATRALATVGGIAPGMTVIDIGGGLGRPARVLAQEFGANVTVVDLTESFVKTGAALTARLGLADRVTFHHGDALALPFTDGSFDLAWTQHATMNIADKERLYAEIHRVLRPGGRLVFHEILAGPVEPLQFPVPWASDASISFLRTPETITALLAQLGFVQVVWNDHTTEALAWFAAMRERAAASPTPPPLSLQLILGDDFGVRIASIGRNYAENRACVVQAVFDRP